MKNIEGSNAAARSISEAPGSSPTQCSATATDVLGGPSIQAAAHHQQLDGCAGFGAEIGKPVCPNPRNRPGPMISDRGRFAAR